MLRHLLGGAMPVAGCCAGALRLGLWHRRVCGAVGSAGSTARSCTAIGRAGAVGGNPSANIRAGNLCPTFYCRALRCCRLPSANALLSLSLSLSLCLPHRSFVFSPSRVRVVRVVCLPPLPRAPVLRLPCARAQFHSPFPSLLASPCHSPFLVLAAATAATTTHTMLVCR